MHKIITTAALLIGLTAASSAHAGAGRWGEDLRFVAQTSVPQSGGTGTVALCQHVDFMSVLFVPVYTRQLGYALSNSDCTGTTYRELSPENFAAMQAAGMIAPDVPANPGTDIVSRLWGHAWLVAVGLGLLFRGFGAVLGRGRGPRRSKSPDALAIHSLVAMSQVAIADGRIDDAEVEQISHILTRLTGKGYSPAQVMDMLTKLNPSPSDLEQVGQDLSENDRQIVLEAALNIAVADGEIHPNEYAVVSDLARTMRIGADQFRHAMARISAHLQTVQPV